LPEYLHLLTPADDIAPAGREAVARWNDGKFVKLAGRSDEQFLDELLDNLDARLAELEDVPRVVAAVHHVPFCELLPPPQAAQWDFVKAFLGSERIGGLLLDHPNVAHVFCGHSHLAAEARVGNIDAVNVGSGYRWKTYRTLDV
jgi:hypothetical protein